MQVWQHTNKSDYLRRRAEDMIDAARKSDKKEASAAANGYRPSVKDARKMEMRKALQETPALTDAQEAAERK